MNNKMWLSLTRPFDGCLFFTLNITSMCSVVIAPMLNSLWEKCVSFSCVPSQLVLGTGFYVLMDILCWFLRGIVNFATRKLMSYCTGAMVPRPAIVWIHIGLKKDLNASFSIHMCNCNGCVFVFMVRQGTGQWASLHRTGRLLLPLHCCSVTTHNRYSLCTWSVILRYTSNSVFLFFSVILWFCRSHVCGGVLLLFMSNNYESKRQS